MGDIEDKPGGKGASEEDVSTGCKASTSMATGENGMLEGQYSIESDSNHLLSLFPEEIWGMIMEKVGDPECLENCTKASAFFCELLEPRRAEYLFPKVLPILLDWCIKDPTRDEHKANNRLSSDEEDEDDWSNERMGRPPRGTKLNMKDLRLVCHCWRKAVESFNAEHPFHFEIDRVPRKQLEFLNEDSDSDSDDDSDCSDDEYFRVENTKAHLTYFKASDDDNVDEFVEEFKNSSVNCNPMFHRKLVIKDGPLSKERVRLFWQSVTTFLQTYGDKIWYCEICLQNNIFGYSYYFIVRQWLELMKNLKVLHWTYPQTWEDLEDSEGYQFGSRIPIFLKCKLEDKVREYPLPKLAHLQVFKTDDLPYPIFREFIKRNDHISKLQFHRKFPPPPEYKEFYEYDFANGLHNITELSVIVWRRTELKELWESTSAWPLLKKFSLYWGNYNYNDYEYKIWAQIFKVVEEKCSSRSFTNLTLRLSKPRLHLGLDAGDTVFTSRKKLKLSLPFLKVLKITLPVEDTTLDFLLPMKDTLEELHVNLECEAGWNISKPIDYITAENQTIQFIGYYDHMLESNIWRLFPNLTKINLKCLIEYRSSPTQFQYLRRNVPEDVLKLENE